MAFPLEDILKFEGRRNLQAEFALDLPSLDPSDFVFHGTGGNQELLQQIVKQGLLPRDPSLFFDILKEKAPSVFFSSREGFLPVSKIAKRGLQVVLPLMYCWHCS